MGERTVSSRAVAELAVPRTRNEMYSTRFTDFFAVKPRIAQSGRQIMRVYCILRSKYGVRSMMGPAFSDTISDAGTILAKMMSQAEYMADATSKAQCSQLLCSLLGAWGAAELSSAKSDARLNRRAGKIGVHRYAVARCL